jgi:uncharacterized membrane protein
MALASLSGGLLAGGGVVLLATAALARVGKLPRNRFLGMRTPATLRSDTAWVAAHRASAWSLVLAAAVLLGAGGWLLSTRPPDETASRASLPIGIAVVAVIVAGGVHADVVARRTAGADKSA